MGAPSFAALAGIGLAVAWPRPAFADEFRTTFDPGNRVRAEASTAGFGGGLAIRHTVDTEAEVTWRLEHAVVSAQIGSGALRGVVYAGRYLRHASDGRILIPIGRPRRIYLPFDVGVEAEVGRVEGDIPTGSGDLGLVRGAALLELTRSDSFRQRLTFGAVGRWDASVEEAARLAEHRVSPFSTAALGLGLESRDGLTALTADAEAGWEWSSERGWGFSGRARASLERVLFAVNDLPVSVFGAGSYAASRDEWSGELGVRIALPTTPGGPR